MAATRATREQWRRRVSAWSASGLACKQFAVQAGVSPSTLAWWKWKLSSEGERFDGTALPFAEVTSLVVAPEERSGEAAPIELRVGDVGVRVPVGFDGTTLARVLDVLEARR